MTLGLKHIVITVSVFWFAYCQLETEERDCPDFWVTNGNFCYFIHPNSSGAIESDLASWDDARSRCRAQHSSRLLYYDSESERRFINEQIDPPFSHGYLWIGLRQHKTGGPYIWENGVTLSDDNTHWEAGQPDKREGEEMCIDILTGDTKATGIWRDRPCADLKGFICKYELGDYLIANR
ncbi:C-type lectin galactose-binding isoform-like [Anneissia japonica]|uniref:C-type lectin galactose-binding isoform-like n=1 Tax=Anneissia japonica TaxID=1529436 RepID=UPI001425882D|nr:C-type lectin galactose-binding isoform-like [Anneissia japonica]